MRDASTTSRSSARASARQNAVVRPRRVTQPSATTSVSDHRAEVADVHVDGHEADVGPIGRTDGRYHDGVDQRAQRPTVDDAEGLFQLGPVWQPHAAIVLTHLLDFEPHIRGEVRAIGPLAEVLPRRSYLGGERLEIIGTHAMKPMGWNADGQQYRQRP